MGLNTLACTTAGVGNTGFGDCYADPKFFYGAFLVPKNFALEAGDMVSTSIFAAALKQKTVAALQSDRIYPIHNFENTTDNSEDVTITTLGHGGKFVAKEGEYDLSYQFIKGGLCLNKALRKFNGRDFAVLFYDSNGVVFGQKVGDTLKGIPLTMIYTAPLKINDGSNQTVYQVRFVFKPSYLNDSPGFFESSVSDLQDITGLEDVALITGGARVANVSKVKAVVGCAQTDLYDIYDSELASALLWEVRDSFNGNLLTLTSVAIDANIKGWALTVDASDPDYSAARAVVIKMKDPFTLNSAGVSGYESNSHTTPN